MKPTFHCRTIWLLHGLLLRALPFQGAALPMAFMAMLRADMALAMLLGALVWTPLGKMVPRWAGMNTWTYISWGVLIGEPCLLNVYRIAEFAALR